MSDLRLVDDFGQFARPQHGHGIDDHRAGFRGCQPDCDHGRIVGRTDQHAIARPDAQILDQYMGQPVGPVRQFLIGAAASVSDQGGVVAKAALDHAVGQFHTDIQFLGIIETVQQEIRLRLGRRQIVPRECIDMGCIARHRQLPLS